MYKKDITDYCAIDYFKLTEYLSTFYISAKEWAMKMGVGWIGFIFQPLNYIFLKILTWLFQIKWISFNILYFSKGMSYEDGSWMNRICFPTSKLYILEILYFRSTLNETLLIDWGERDHVLFGVTNGSSPIRPLV